MELYKSWRIPDGEYLILVKMDYTKMDGMKCIEIKI